MVDPHNTGTQQLRRSPVTALQDRLAAESHDRVALRELGFAVMTALRMDLASEAAGRVRAVLGCDLPASVGDVTGAGERSVLWLAPDEFLTWAPDGAADPVASAEELAEAIGTDRGQAVDVSANRTTLELAGPRAASVLAKGCSLDLHPRAFAVGSARTTLLCDIPVIIWRVGDDTWRVLPRSSFAEHLASWLLDGMAEFADERGEPLWR